MEFLGILGNGIVLDLRVEFLCIFGNFLEFGKWNFEDVGGEFWRNFFEWNFWHLQLKFWDFWGFWEFGIGIFGNLGIEDFGIFGIWGWKFWGNSVMEFWGFPN